MMIHFGDAYMLGNVCGRVHYIHSCAATVSVDLIRAFSSRLVKR